MDISRGKDHDVVSVSASARTADADTILNMLSDTDSVCFILSIQIFNY